MMRAIAAIGLVCLAQSTPAMAMPNAFWIFGFHVPGKHGVRSDVVVTPAREAVAATTAPTVPVATAVATPPTVPTAQS